MIVGIGSLLAVTLWRTEDRTMRVYGGQQMAAWVWDIGGCQSLIFRLPGINPCRM
jgi:hypothetical protein